MRPWDVDGAPERLLCSPVKPLSSPVPALLSLALDGTALPEERDGTGQRLCCSLPRDTLETSVPTPLRGGDTGEAGAALGPLRCFESSGANAFGSCRAEAAGK